MRPVQSVALCCLTAGIAIGIASCVVVGRSQGADQGDQLNSPDRSPDRGQDAGQSIGLRGVDSGARTICRIGRGHLVINGPDGPVPYMKTDAGLVQCEPERELDRVIGPQPPWL